MLRPIMGQTVRRVRYVEHAKYDDAFSPKQHNGIVRSSVLNK